MINLSFTVLALLIATQVIVCTKERSSKNRLKDSTLVISHRHYKHHKNLRTKNLSERCEIFCPILIVFPNSNVTTTSPRPTNNVTTTSPRPTNNVTKSSASSTKITTSQPTKKPSNQNGRKSDRQIQKGKSVHITHAGNEMYKSRSSTNKRKYTYHDLNPHQKHLLLKQLNLGNSNGKKSYEFRQTSTSLCRVVCLEENVQSNTPAPRESTTEGSDDSDEDSYEEGEDTPIEATVKPAIPQSIVIGGIRPFGGVDFNGWDDFGPNGELARDIPEPDDKHN